MPAAAETGASIFGYMAASEEAKAMMPEEYHEELERLKRQKEQQGLGLTEAQRQQMEQDATVQRGGVLADAQARQLQQAQMLAAQPAYSGRDMFMAELATQQAQAQMQAQQARQIAAANEAQRLRDEQALLELAQRKASSEAAQKRATATLASDIFAINANAIGNFAMAGGQAGLQGNFLQGAAAGQGPAAGSTAYSSASAYPTQATQQQNAQMMMGMAGAYSAPPPQQADEQPLLYNGTY